LGCVDACSIGGGDGRDAIHAANLPAVHQDPFDRLLIAQARMENLVLVTRDSRIALYDVPQLRA